MSVYRGYLCAVGYASHGYSHAIPPGWVLWYMDSCLEVRSPRKDFFFSFGAFLLSRQGLYVTNRGMHIPWVIRYTSLLSSVGGE
ncbi:MAG: hypothetical protein LUG51_06685 [Tannerellaceae bacterium]|nr:hypothetical protein [Tannerellaceae bacterium]